MAVVSDISNLFDTYSRQARLYPALLVLLPVFVAVGVCYPTLASSPSVATLAAAAIACGILYLLTNIVRTLGKAVESKLLKAWGGWPTTEMLRWSGPTDHHTLRRYHTVLQSKLPTLTFPDAASELSRGAEADDTYASAVRWLKEQCRGTDYPLVEKENAQYGFRRNAFGAKGIAIGTCVLSAALIVAFMVHSATGFHGTLAEIVLKTIAYASTTSLIDGGLLLIIMLTLWWLFGATPAWVQQAGRDYATALLAACEKLT